MRAPLKHETFLASSLTVGLRTRTALTTYEGEGIPAPPDLLQSFALASLFSKFKTTLEMIKFEHTLFALPFAFLGAIMAANGLPTWRQLLWITVAMVGARSAAMTFNRIADREIDAQNPRTANRELPTGKLTVGFAWLFMYVSIGVFLLA